MKGSKYFGYRIKYFLAIFFDLSLFPLMMLDTKTFHNVTVNLLDLYLRVCVPPWDKKDEPEDWMNMFIVDIIGYVITNFIINNSSKLCGFKNKIIAHNNTNDI